MCLPNSVAAMRSTLPAFVLPARPRYIPLPMTCDACGAQLSQSAKFCHKCGAAVATAGVTGWRAGLPWALAGAALGALGTVIVMRATTAPARDDQIASGGLPAPFANGAGG